MTLKKQGIFLQNLRDTRGVLGKEVDDNIRRFKAENELTDGGGNKYKKRRKDKTKKKKIKTKKIKTKKRHYKKNKYKRI